MDGGVVERIVSDEENGLSGLIQVNFTKQL